MSDDPKTVRIKPSHPSQGEFVVINEADFNPDVHELLDLNDVVLPVKTSDLFVGKGPRGRWYVKRGKEIVCGPFETEDEALRQKAIEVAL